MSFNRKLLSILACPRCKGGLKLEESEAGLLCLSCGLSYPIRDGIPSLLAEEAGSIPEKGGLSSGVPQQAGVRMKFIVVEGKNKGEVLHLEQGTCRAIGRSLDDKERTQVSQVGTAVTLDDVSKKLVMNYISKQYEKAAHQPRGGNPLGNFQRKRDIFLKDKAVSRLHAMIFYGDAGVGILDLVSKNGTYVGGAEVESKLLKKGDIVALGSTKMRLE